MLGVGGLEGGRAASEGRVSSDFCEEELGVGGLEGGREGGFVAVGTPLIEDELGGDTFIVVAAEFEIEF